MRLPGEASAMRADCDMKTQSFLNLGDLSMTSIRSRLLLASGVLLLVACGGTASEDGSATDAELRREIQAQGLVGDPSAGARVPSIDDPLAALGRKLFFSKSLGGDRDTACASCHHPMLGGGDALPQSIGVGAVEAELLGPGRSHPDGDLSVPRNAPTTFNIALWKRAQFWDSRVERLDDDGIRTPDSDFGSHDPDAGESLSEAQSRFPVTSEEEMRGFDFAVGGSNATVRAALERRLIEDGRWADEFDNAFASSEISYARIAKAIATYEDSQVFTETPWRAYVEGDLQALEEPAKRGALLFFRGLEEGGADCARCHSGDFFTDEDFHSIAAPQLGRGKGDGFRGTNDFGRARESGDRNDRFAFRTPTLLNVSVTGPYLHSGAYADLEEVIRQHLDPRAAIARFEPVTVPLAASEDFERNRQELIDFLAVSGRAIDTFDAPLELSEGKISDLVAFLETLTDPCVLLRSCLERWIADPRVDDVDGQLLVATDQDRNTF